MATDASDAYLAGRLLQWALRPRERPAQEPEYASLIDRYLDRPAFRLTVLEVARGLGLDLLDVGEHGVVLAPSTSSAFALEPADFRAGRTVDDRLLDGLVQVAIACTVFPRSRDLDEEATLARPPVTVDEIEDHLRTMCERLAQAARAGADPVVDDDLAGLEEAWRLYLRRQAATATRDGRQSDRATRRVIEASLERLGELGCFARRERAALVEYQPTWRYQVLVKELAASTIYQSVRTRTWLDGGP